jgi:uncharacterized peroxidase-related enzyme
MPYFKSMRADAGPPTVFTLYPELYGPWSQMSQALMNGPSPFSEGERELLLSFAAGAAGCRFVCIAHSEVAYAWGLERGLVEQLLEDLEAAPIEPRWKPLLAFVRKLSAEPTSVGQQDADAVFAAGWDEHALHDAIAIVARAAFMHRLVSGFGFDPLSPDDAARHARKRVERGYVNLYAVFRDRAPQDDQKEPD